MSNLRVAAPGSSLALLTIHGAALLGAVALACGPAEGPRNVEQNKPITGGPILDNFASGYSQLPIVPQYAIPPSPGRDYDVGAETFTGYFDPTGSMSVVRSEHTATPLDNGKVLIAGGMISSSPDASIWASIAEVYDASTRTFASIAGTSRLNYTATKLLDGKVLVAGGNRPAVEPSAVVYDPSTETFTATVGSMVDPERAGHKATLLPNGKVLITGGGCPSGSVTAELYDPATSRFAATSMTMREPRCSHTATLLDDGKVLIAGGYYRQTAELYDPVTGQFSFTPGLMTVPRIASTATKLLDGKVLIAGGIIQGTTATAELFNPSSGTFTVTGSMSHARYTHTATLLPDGTVLMAGGLSGWEGGLASCEIYDPSVHRFIPTGSMSLAREGASAALLGDGTVLLAGGVIGRWYDFLGFTHYVRTATTELYEPGPIAVMTTRAIATRPWLSGTDTGPRLSHKLRSAAAYWGINFADLQGYTIWLKAADESVCGYDPNQAGGCYWDLTSPWDGYSATIELNYTLHTCVEGYSTTHEVGHGALQQLTGSPDGTHSNPLWGSGLNDLFWQEIGAHSDCQHY